MFLLLVNVLFYTSRQMFHRSPQQIVPFKRKVLIVKPKIHVLTIIGCFAPSRNEQNDIWIKRHANYEQPFEQRYHTHTQPHFAK